ncbi:putative ABC transport system ATP-binding protein [Ruminiclostridium sufflavum DSM 19573]|uniref:Putative ABC transport system ATP-binding protein n=1 Tax=Ruminiclostridium sufflavum DSM 19573 TaxID=1121337 RepID=A0A318XM83_9FIRM|nr:ABC transporter ATP-binding protein [Ruminiclostridium sufflavum]PYG88537.1 putative ABC transport system ATP-binding protein [Ruminiclostridium sufflavum DSM 19573]
MTIAVAGVTKEYKRGDRIFKAVDGVSLIMESGDFIAVIGKSGSGKSTLLNIIAGLTVPTSGNVLVDGESILTYSDSAMSDYRSNSLGYIPQGQSTLADLTVLDNVRLPFHLSGRKGDSASRALTLLEQVGIADLKGNYPKHLSGGELKRVAIARALINDPDILIADEPTSDLDKQTTAEVLALLQSISKDGKAVLIVTHDLAALEYTTRNFTMVSGVLTQQAKIQMI